MSLYTTGQTQPWGTLRQEEWVMAIMRPSLFSAPWIHLLPKSGNWFCSKPLVISSVDKLSSHWSEMQIPAQSPSVRGSCRETTLPLCTPSVSGSPCTLSVLCTAGDRCEGQHHLFRQPAGTDGKYNTFLKNLYKQQWSQIKFSSHATEHNSSGNESRIYLSYLSQIVHVFCLSALNFKPSHFQYTVTERWCWMWKWCLVLWCSAVLF